MERFMQFATRAASNRKLGLLVLVLAMAASATVLVLFPMDDYYAGSLQGAAGSPAGIVSSASGGWVDDGSKDSLYGEDKKAKDISKDVDEEEPGTVMSLFLEFLGDFNDSIQKLFDTIGLNFQTITMGRIGGRGILMEGTRIAPYTFEMASGNPYGIVAMAVYGTLRTIVYVLMACVLHAKFAAAMYSSNPSRAMSAVKENLSGMVFGFAGLALMPWFLDMAIYIRDVSLNAVASSAKDLLGLGSINPTTMFKDIVAKKATFMNECMYIGSFVLMIYYAASYVGIALNMVVNVIAFPFICLNMQFDRQAMGMWARSVLGDLLVSIADCCLLLIPAVFGMIGDTFAVAVVQFLVCCSIVPARMTLRKLLGSQGNPGMELAGFATMLGAARLGSAAMKNTAGAFKSGMDGMKDSKESREKGDMYSDLARAEKGIAPEPMAKPAIGDRARSAYSYGKSSLAHGIGSARQARKGGNSRFGAFKVGIGAAASDLSKGMGLADIPGKTKAMFGGRLDAQPRQPQEASADAEDFSGGGDAARQAVLEKYANKDNFEDAEFKGLSNEKKAELYRQCAKSQKRRAVGKMMGQMAGAASGGIGGMAASAFLGPAASMHVMAGAMNAGGSIGGMAGSAFDAWANRNMKYAAPGGGLAGPDMPPEAASVPGQGTYGLAGAAPSGIAWEDKPNYRAGVIGDKTGYYREFLSKNGAAMVSQVRRSYDISSGTAANGALRNIYRQSPGITYRDFRNEASEALQALYVNDVVNHPDFISGTDRYADMSIVKRSAQSLTNTVVNPKNGDGSQAWLEPGAVLSRENLARNGFAFHE